MQNLPWSGYKEDNEIMELEKIDSLFISPVDGQMHGSGTDKFGNFSISGKVELTGQTKEHKIEKCRF